MAFVVLKAAADTDPHVARADFDRCSSQMDRVGRNLRSYEQTVRQLQTDVRGAGAKAIERFGAELTILENRAGLFRNRIERAASQAEKTGDELRNVTGPACPSCVVSAVNLFCRSVEAVETELDSYAARAAELQAALREFTGARFATPDTALSYQARAATLDSLVKSTAAVLDTCTVKSAVVLHRQARLNIARADSLHRARNDTGAATSLEVAETLLRKAYETCAAR